jgi:hypothetical protein
VAVLQVEIGEERGFGLLALYKSGPVFETMVVDAEGRVRPDWAAVLRRRPLPARRLPVDLVRGPTWGPTVRRLGGLLDTSRRPVALAGVVVGP